MDWFERHLNWTGALGYLIWFVPNANDSAVLTNINLVFQTTVSIIIPGWVIKQKRRSLWWLLLSPLFSSLWLKNIQVKPVLLDDLYKLEQRPDDVGEEKANLLSWWFSPKRVSSVIKIITGLFICYTFFEVLIRNIIDLIHTLISPPLYIAAAYTLLPIISAIFTWAIYWG